MAPEPSPPPSRVRFFRRSSSDRYLGGVSGGIAERLATDPAYVRMGLVAAVLYLAYADDHGLHALVLVPYALLWATVPSTSDRPLVLRLRDRDARRETALLVVALVAALVLLNRPSSIVVLGLGGLAVALLRDRPPAAVIPTTGEADADAGDPVQSWSPRSVLARRAGPERPLFPKREPALWPLTLGLLVVVAMVALAMDQATNGRVDPRIVIDVALLAVGAVLVLSAWRGRARITVLAVVALLPLWVATSVPDVGRFAGEGSVTARPTTLPTSSVAGMDATLSYEVGYGTMDIDLRDLPVKPGKTATVELGVTAGRATVMVPADARLRVRGSVGLGAVEVQAPSHHRSDSDAAVNRSFNRSYPALGTDCQHASVGDDELANLARQSGLIADDGTGRPLTSEEIASAIAAAGYPRPSVDYVAQIDDHGVDGYVFEEFDEYGDPVTTTTSLDDPNTPTVTFWNVQLARHDYGLCRPVAPPADPATIIIEPTVGLGTLEIHRV